MLVKEVKPVRNKVTICFFGVNYQVYKVMHDIYQATNNSICFRKLTVKHNPTITCINNAC